MFNSFGNLFKITTFGESHGTTLGVVIDGCPCGVNITKDYIQDIVNTRKPNQNPFTTPRSEPDEIEILSGIFNDITLGTPIAVIVKNKDAKSSDYYNLQNIYRPGHADFTWKQKFHHVDYRGGGRSSARETVARVIASAFAHKIIEHYTDIKIYAFLSQIGTKEISPYNINYDEIMNNHFYTADASIVPEWELLLKDTIAKKDSLGSCVSIHIKNTPVGLGEPIFYKLNAVLGHALFSIPAVKGVEFGEGFNLINKNGSQVNDSLHTDTSGNMKHTSNNNGGISGGISNGEDILIKVAIKPTSSIGIEQNTVTHNKENTSLKIKGRHDPCIGIRAVSVCKAMCSLVLADMILLKKNNNINS